MSQNGLFYVYMYIGQVHFNFIYAGLWPITVTVHSKQSYFLVGNCCKKRGHLDVSFVGFILHYAFSNCICLRQYTVSLGFKMFFICIWFGTVSQLINTS